MIAYTAQDILEILEEKAEERYYGSITLHLEAGCIGVVEYNKKERKEDALRDNRKASLDGSIK